MRANGINYDGKIEKVIESKLRTGRSYFHYTEINGFMGIVKSNVMWASHIRFINDRKEYTDGYELTVKLLNEMNNLSSNDECERSIINKIAENRDSYSNGKMAVGSLKNTERYNSDEIFVLCFCESEDSLSQWRGYGKLAGIAIEFDLEGCSFEIGKHISDSKPYKVIYNDEEKNKTIECIYKEQLEGLSKKLKNRGGGTADSADFLLASLFALAPYLKNKSFKDEEEARLLFRRNYIDSNDIRYRERNGIILPYIEVRCKDRNGNPGWPIKSLVVGPGKNQEDVYQSVLYFVSNNKIIDVEKVKKSNIPFRE